MAVTREKAKKILRDGKIRGKPITKAQRGHFGAIAGGRSIPSRLKKKR